MNIKLKNKFLYFNEYRIKCSIGKRGITARKIEGDCKTPRGIFGFRTLFYRKDRILKIKSSLKKIIIKKNMGWCDDPKSKNYNKMIKFPFNCSAEKLWLKKNIYDIIGNGSGFFQHGHTYMGHPVACAAGLAVLKAILSRNLLKSINKKSDQLLYSLKTQLAHNPYVGDIRGRGLFIGIEIVKNLETKKPFAPDLKIASSIKYAAFKAGLICYPMSGTRDGKWGDHILLAPPFIMNESQIIELVDKVSIALKVIK